MGKRKLKSVRCAWCLGDYNLLYDLNFRQGVSHSQPREDLHAIRLADGVPLPPAGYYLPQNILQSRTSSRPQGQTRGYDSFPCKVREVRSGT